MRPCRGCYGGNSVGGGGIRASPKLEDERSILKTASAGWRVGRKPEPHVAFMDAQRPATAQETRRAGRAEL